MALNGRIEKGGMPDITPEEIILNPGEEFKIKNGYHFGTGKCKVPMLSTYTNATATPNDIVYGFSGYVNGNRIRGNVAEMEHVSNYLSFANDNDRYNIFFARGVYTKDEEDLPQILIPSSEVAKVGGLTSVNLVAGKRCCDVVGGYTADATATEDDIVLNKIGFSNGQMIVGKVKPNDVYNIGIRYNEDDMSYTFSWNNPTNGPYQGLTITDVTNGANTVLYNGAGSNKVADGRSSITLTGFKNKIYSIEFRCYCGSLISNNVFSFRLEDHISKIVFLTNGRYINNAINKNATSFTRANLSYSTVPSDATDISEAQDGSIVTWYDSTNTTQYWYSDADIIYMNEYSSMMFSECTSLTSLDLSHFDTSNVTNMGYMFNECNKLTSLDLSSFNTSKVTTMDNMFNRCFVLTTLSVPNFNTQKVTNMTYMFSNCYSLTTITYSDKFVNDAITSSTSTINIFYNCPANKPNWTNGTWDFNGSFIKS